MSNINGKLLRVADPDVALASENGSVEIALCGYGPQVPKGPGGTYVRLSYTIKPPDPANTQWDAVVSGNDVIRPAGTYYTVTYKDSNGDIAQIEAYLFLDAGTYDLDFTDPFDPTLPPPPLPPLIINQLQSIVGGAAPAFDAAHWLSFQLTLNQNAAPTVAGVQPGNLYTFIIVQDGAGNHTLTWPANIFNATSVNPKPNGWTIQTFVADENANLYSISAATWWTP